MKTDTQIQKDVMAELSWLPAINAETLQVQVVDGIVTLAGHVNSYAQKCLAEQAVQAVTGVKALAVELDVEISGATGITDRDLAHAAHHVIKWLVSLPPERVKVRVEGGWITLSGEVNQEFQRHDALNAVAGLRGVTGVSDQITVKESLSSTQIKTEIEAALNRRANDTQHNISVSVEGSDVTLSGSIQNWQERVLAKHAASGTPGVRKVIDDLILVA
jgi:osmotically-inducible protein OsmY